MATKQGNCMKLFSDENIKLARLDAEGAALGDDGLAALAFALAD